MKPIKLYSTYMLLMSFAMGVGTAQALTPQEELGKSIFFDKNLSLKKNQSCANCHDPRVGWTGPIPGINKKGAVYPGSIKTKFGARKPPTSSYATTAPILHYIVENGDALFIGGNFWDGRATGEKLGNPAADQAQGPFLNPVEQALPDPACVVHRVCNAKTPAQYPVAFGDVYPGACDINWSTGIDKICSAGEMIELDPADREKVNAAYDNIGLSVAAYEASAEVNQYSSKFDAYLAGQAELTAEEQRGLDIFAGKGKCAACHVLEPQQNGEPTLFTDYTFDNLGVPKNPENPEYDNDPNFVDLGLGGFLATRLEYAAFADDNMGKHKVPTLRNVDQRPGGNGFTKAYMHNGYFKTLEGVVNFYNTRDIKPICPEPLTSETDALAQDCWPVPEVAANVNSDELGNLGLTNEEEAALVAIMKTLSDGYFEPLP